MAPITDLVALAMRPFFEPIAGRLRFFGGETPPGVDALNAVLERLAQPPQAASGAPVRFVLPAGNSGGYEERVYAKGEVETRPDNWHDWFNGLVWLTFPRAKAALSARHAAELDRAADARGAVRDAMTHFDECGALVVAEDASLLDLLAGFRWRELFVERRPEAIAGLRVFVFGHATYEALLAPFRGLTAKCVPLPVAAGWLRRPLAEQLADLDDRLAADLAAGRHGDPRALQPLPLLGVPGVTPASEDPAYYDDTWQFRPGRRRQRV